jgi:hypothetical protein
MLDYDYKQCGDFVKADRVNEIWTIILRYIRA